MEPCNYGTTRRLTSRSGAGRHGRVLPFRSRYKNVLAMPSYRSGHFTNIPGPTLNWCNGDITPIVVP